MFLQEAEIWTRTTMWWFSLLVVWQNWMGSSERDETGIREDCCRMVKSLDAPYFVYPHLELNRWTVLPRWVDKTPDLTEPLQLTRSFVVFVRLRRSHAVECFAALSVVSQSWWKLESRAFPTEKQRKPVDPSGQVIHTLTSDFCW